MAIKKYDLIYIPEKCKPNEMHMAIVGNSKSLTEATDVIVVSEEELSEYCAGFFRWWWNEKGTNTTHAADDYVKNVNPPTTEQ